MKIRKWHVVIVSIGLVVLISFLFLQNNESNFQLRKLLIWKELDGVVAEKDKVALSSQNKYTILNIDIYDSNNIKYSLKDQIGNESKLVLKFSSMVCSYCLEHVIDNIKEYEKKIGSKNIILLGEFVNEFAFSRFKKINDLKINIFNVHRRELGLPVDTLHLPYFVITDSSLIPKDVFVPLKESPKRTSDFLNQSVGSYFKEGTLVDL